MIRFLIGFKRSHPGLWEVVEKVNGFLFRLFFGNISKKADMILAGQGVAGCSFATVQKSDLDSLKHFLDKQPKDYLEWFDPHDFDLKTLERLFKNPAFLMMKVCSDSGEMVGYFFLRSFFVGRSFAGLLVDRDWQNRGIGSQIWHLQSQICKSCGLKMRATISTDNKPSIASCRKGTSMTELQKLENGYIAVECKTE